MSHMSGPRHRAISMPCKQFNTDYGDFDLTISITKFRDPIVYFKSLGTGMAPHTKFENCWCVLLKKGKQLKTGNVKLCSFKEIN